MTELTKSDFLNRILAMFASEAASQGMSLSELSKEIGKQPSYLAQSRSRGTEIGAYSVYQLLNKLNLDPRDVFLPVGDYHYRPPSPLTDMEAAEKLIEVALQRVRQRQNDEETPSLDRILHEWRAAKGRISRFPTEFLEHCDVYKRPNEDGTLNPDRIGRYSLVAQALGTQNASAFKNELRNAPIELSLEAAHNQAVVLVTRNPFFTTKKLAMPLRRGVRLEVEYDQLTNYLEEDDGSPRLLVFSRRVSAKRSIISPLSDI